MKIELPLENWTDVFGFLPRSLLAKLVPHIGESSKRESIGDRQFVSFVQFVLHKCGEVTLDKFDIVINTPNNESGIVIYNHANSELPLADVPIPGNIKNFKEIRIFNLDDTVIRFLQEDSYDIRSNLYLMDSIQCKYLELAMPMLISARILHSIYNCRDCWFTEWLHTPRADGKPRVLVLQCPVEHIASLNSHLQLLRHVKKDFMEATRAVSFFIHLNNFHDSANAQFLSIDNSKTNEKLVIKGADQHSGPMRISRYPMDAAEEWIEEMAKYEEDYEYRNIAIDLY